MLRDHCQLPWKVLPVILFVHWCTKRVPTYLFCSETETSRYLFFECVVAVQMWDAVSQAVGRYVGNNFESISICWFSLEKFTVVNMVCAATL
jgi:hypothetical protein